VWFLPPLPPTFEAALRDVRARGVDARIAAAERLGRPEQPDRARAATALRTLANDADARVRAAAIRALTELGDGGSLSLLTERLDDADPLVRELSVMAIAALGLEHATSTLLQALQSPHPEVRFQAVACYVETCEQPDLAAVTALLEDADAKVRAHAARSLGQVGVAARSVARVGDAARVALLTALRDPEPTVTREAAIALARLGSEAGKDELSSALADPELMVDALDAIGELALREAAPAIAPLALSVLRPWAVKVAAARALVRLRDPRGELALQQVLGAFRSGGRNYAVQVVGELRVTSLAPRLARLASRPRGTDPEVLAEALAALLPDPDAAAGLRVLAGGRGEAARKAAEALERPRPDFPD
jgi:HEAT repeat protein